MESISIVAAFSSSSHSHQFFTTATPHTRRSSLLFSSSSSSSSSSSPLSLSNSLSFTNTHKYNSHLKLSISSTSSLSAAASVQNDNLVGDHDLLIVGPGVLGRILADKWRQRKILPSFHNQEKMQRLRNTLEFSSEKVFTMLRNHHLPHAKTTGFFLVLVPLIAFCIRCLISVVKSKVVKKAGEISLNRSKGHPHASERKSQRWRCALSDISDPDNLQSVSRM